jgi:hypothetical protein
MIKAAQGIGEFLDLPANPRKEKYHLAIGDRYDAVLS